ncbi:class F sortase [Arthrobacter sp. FW305-123]|nr:class F sortase [Arthrobacter sp. FW305-123]
MRHKAAQRGRRRRSLFPEGPVGRRWGGAALLAFLTAVLLAVLLPGLWSAPEPALNSQPVATAPQQSPATSPSDAQALRSPSAVAEGPALQPQLSGGRVPLEAGAPPLHITYDAVGLDQSVVPLTPTAQELELNSIVPPHTPDAYWLSPYGMPGEGSINTTYVVGHSVEGGGSPFNNISALAKAGDLLTVTTAEGPLIFRVDGVSTEYKDTLRDSKIWDIVPGRLVLITCYAADLWGKNIIVQASPLPAG